MENISTKISYLVEKQITKVTCGCGNSCFVKRCKIKHYKAENNIQSNIFLLP